jgi:hypothetical protein
MKISKSKKTELILELGVPQDNIEEQLIAQNLDFDKRKIRRFDDYIKTFIKMRDDGIISKKRFDKYVNYIYLEAINHVYQYQRLNSKF